MHRDWVGWSESVSHEELFERNRGIWLLGSRAQRERYATFSVDGVVRMVAEIDGIEVIPSEDPARRSKSAIIGRVLGPGDEAYDTFVGTPVDSHRNPVSYIDDPDTGPRTCACACGEPVPGARIFAPGHDQRAVHERIGRQWGSTLAFIRWFDDTFPEAA